jgi:hypothetical protein
MPNYRPPSTKVIPPAPPGYRANFEKGGWRLVERMYGARTDLHLKWQEMTGCQSRRQAAVKIPADGGMVQV